MRHILIALVASVVLRVTGYADTHYVNPAGSNEAPYTSYATGAHIIQDAIDQAVAGDTVRVTAGLYRPNANIILKDSIAVIGAGRDSTVVHPENDDFGHIFIILGSGSAPGGGIIFEGFTIQGFNSPVKNYPDQHGLVIHSKRSTTNRVSKNRFYYCYIAASFADADVIVTDNWFDSNRVAIEISFNGPFDVHENTIIGWPIGGGEASAKGITYFWSLHGPARVHHNKIFTHYGFGISLRNTNDSLYVYNNLIVTGGVTGMWLYCDCAGAVVRNNTIIRNMPDPHDLALAKFAVEDGSEFLIENNIFQAVNGAVELVHGWDEGGSWRFAYNDLWGMDYDGLTCEAQWNLDSVGNLNRYPMLTNDSACFLQRGSPLIDVGNPSIFDLDGTRSDVGWTGGPEGEMYSYSEEPPRQPDTLQAEPNGEVVNLTWPGNVEADLAAYRLYRESYSGFTPKPENLLATTASAITNYTDSIGEITENLYYVLTAVDGADMESAPSNEATVYSTGIFDDSEIDIDHPHTPYVIVNYPNPFNTSTIIEYYIPDVGARPTLVQLVIYDAMGRKVSTLVNRKLYPGKHRVSWEGRTDSGNVAASGVYFARLNVWGYEFKSSVKLVMQK